MMLGLIIIESLILIVFYTYSAFTDLILVPLDICSFFTGIWLSRITGLRLFSIHNYTTLNVFALILFLLSGVMFAWFTFNPPDYPIFIDQNTGTAGIHP